MGIIPFYGVIILIYNKHFTDRSEDVRSPSIRKKYLLRYILLLGQRSTGLLFYISFQAIFNVYAKRMKQSTSKMALEQCRP